MTEIWQQMYLEVFSEHRVPYRRRHAAFDVLGLLQGRRLSLRINFAFQTSALGCSEITAAFSSAWGD